MNSMGVMCMLVGKSCGMFIFIPLTSHLFDKDPRNLTYVIVGCACALVVLIAVMNMVLYCHKEKKDGGQVVSSDAEQESDKEMSEVKIAI